MIVASGQAAKSSQAVIVAGGHVAVGQMADGWYHLHKLLVMITSTTHYQSLATIIWWPPATISHQPLSPVCHWPLSSTSHPMVGSLVVLVFKYILVTSHYQPLATSHYHLSQSSTSHHCCGSVGRVIIVVLVLVVSL